MKFEDFWVHLPEAKQFHHSHYIGIHITEEEYNRFYKDFVFPIIDTDGSQYWFNKIGRLHNLDGYAAIHKRFSEHFINGKAYFDCGDLWLRDRKPLFWKRIYFLREKIICLQKLVEIPELYQEVYYSRKSEFMELLKKL